MALAREFFVLHAAELELWQALLKVGDRLDHLRDHPDPNVRGPVEEAIEEVGSVLRLPAVTMATNLRKPPMVMRRHFHPPTRLDLGSEGKPVP